jgi:hypothetical protein
MTFMGFQEPFNNLLALLAVIMTAACAIEIVVVAFRRPSRKERPCSKN